MTKAKGPPMVTVPWGDEKKLPRELQMRAYQKCKRGDKGHCINTNLVRAFAEHQRREIRCPQTYGGALHWSEQVDGKWCQFVAPLSVKYAEKIDAFDAKADHFAGPSRCPMGPVRFLGFSEPTKMVDPAVRRERRERMEARIASGELVPGKKWRDPQVPFVAPV